MKSDFNYFESVVLPEPGHPNIIITFINEIIYNLYFNQIIFLDMVRNISLILLNLLLQLMLD